MSAIRKIILQDKQQGQLKVAFPIPRDTPYGFFLPLASTYWRGLLPIVTEDALNHALQGWATPLVRELGPSGYHLSKKVLPKDRLCKEVSTCTMATSNCVIGCKKLPECFQSNSEDSDVAECVRQLVLLWAEGYSVIIIAPNLTEES